MAQVDRAKNHAGTAALLVAAAILVASVAVSLLRGHPAAAAGELSSGSPGSDPDPLASLERTVAQQPRDATGWGELGQRYYDAGRYADAARAYAGATRADPRQAMLWSALGEARIMASPHDPFPADAADAFSRALAIDPRDPRARYFQAVQRDLGGDHAGAIDAWLALLADTPPGAPWESDLRRTISQVGAIDHIAVAKRLAAVRQPAPAPAPAPAPPSLAAAGPLADPALAGIPGPSAEQLRAAASIPPSQQDAMVQGMIAKLEARLRARPGDVDGWSMLIRSRMVLNQPDQAASVLADAIAANPARARELRGRAAELGVR